MAEREVRELAPMADSAEVGRWLSALVDSRRDTLTELEGVPDHVVDARPPGSENSIGTTLYHVALIEGDWLFDDILGIALEDSELASLFPYSDRDATGQLVDVRDVTLTGHLDRLAGVREVLLARLRPMSFEDFHAPRRRERYDVSPAWVVHHLLQHESEHRSEIGWLRRHSVSMEACVNAPRSSSLSLMVVSAHAVRVVASEQIWRMIQDVEPQQPHIVGPEGCCLVCDCHVGGPVVSQMRGARGKWHAVSLDCTEGAPPAKEFCPGSAEDVLAARHH